MQFSYKSQEMHHDMHWWIICSMGETVFIGSAKNFIAYALELQAEMRINIKMHTYLKKIILHHK